MFQNLHRSLRRDQTLKIACEGCDHQTIWTASEAFARLGPDATPFEIRRRLGCSACGHKGRARFWI
jgi:hypothetical protein